MRANLTRAFTLIELLVVILVITILLAILLPRLRDRAAERMLVCSANLRSIAQATESFRADHRYKAWPTVAVLNTPTGPELRDDLELPHEAWVCPGARNYWKPYRQEGNATNDVDSPLYLSYGLSMVPSGQTELTWGNRIEMNLPVAAPTPGEAVAAPPTQTIAGDKAEYHHGGKQVMEQIAPNAFQSHWLGGWVQSVLLDGNVKKRRSVDSLACGLLP